MKLSIPAARKGAVIVAAAIALLRRLAPEGGEVGRDREGVEDLAFLGLELRDLRRVVGRAVLVAARVDDREAGLRELRREVRAHRVAVGVVGVEDANRLLVLTGPFHCEL